MYVLDYLWRKHLQWEFRTFSSLADFRSRLKSFTQLWRKINSEEDLPGTSSNSFFFPFWWYDFQMEVFYYYTRLIFFCRINNTIRFDRWKWIYAMDMVENSTEVCWNTVLPRSKLVSILPASVRRISYYRNYLPLLYIEGLWWLVCMIY